MHDTTSWRTCPCDPCRDRTRAYNRDYMRSKRKDPAPRLVPAGPVVDHLAALRASGWSTRDLADVSGYARSTLMRVLRGETQLVRSVMVEDLLSIEVPS